MQGCSLRYICNGINQVVDIYDVVYVIAINGSSFRGCFEIASLIISITEEVLLVNFCDTKRIFLIVHPILYILLYLGR